MKLYQITNDALAIEELINSAVDENGDPRELTEDELGIITHFFLENQENFEEKAEAYGKVMANLKIQEENVKAEKDNFKAEMDRLSNRAKAFSNRRETLKNNLFYAMKLMHKDKIKTDLFSFTIQNKPMSIDTESAVISSIPDKYLKKEISKSLISQAIKNGELIVTPSGAVIIESTGELLEGVVAVKDKTLVIR